MRIDRLLHFDDMAMTCGCARAYGYRPKPLWGTIAGTVLGLGSSIWGGAQSAKKNAEAKAEMDEWHAKDNAWYQRRYNEDYADTAAGQNLIRQAKDYANNNWKHAHGAAAVGGGTDAAVAMAKESGNKMVGDTVANIAAQDVARKTNVDNQHQQNERSYSAQKVALAQQEAQNTAKVAGAASDALMKAGLAFDGSNSGSTAPNVNSGNVTLAGGNSKDFSLWG